MEFKFFLERQNWGQLWGFTNPHPQDCLHTQVWNPSLYYCNRVKMLSQLIMLGCIMGLPPPYILQKLQVPNLSTPQEEPQLGQTCELPPRWFRHWRQTMAEVGLLPCHCSNDEPSGRPIQLFAAQISVGTNFFSVLSCTYVNWNSNCMFH